MSTLDTPERIENAGPITRGIAVWTAVFIGPIGAWTVHLLVLSSIVRLTCNTRNGWTWAIHLTTVVTLAFTGFCMLLSWRLYRAGTDDESVDTTSGRLRFLGILGLAIGAFNLALIGLEEVYVIALNTHRCV